MALDQEVGCVRTRLRRIQVSQVKLLVETCYSTTDDVIEEMVCAKIPTHSQLDTHQELKDKIDQRDELIRSLQDVLGAINSERLRFQCACEGIELQLQGELQELKEVAIQGKITERREQAAGAEEEEETAPPPQPVPEPESVSLEDEEDSEKNPPCKDADKKHSAWGSSLDGSPEVPSDGSAGDIELQAPQQASRVATHHKIESLEDLEEVKGKMKRGDTVGLVHLEKKLCKDNGSADIGKVHKVADFLEAANDGGITVIELLLGDNRLGVAGTEVLAPHLPKELKDLNLMNNWLGVAGTEVLAPHLPKGLKDLNLMNNELGVKGMKVLAPHLPKELKDLNIISGVVGLHHYRNRIDIRNAALEWEPLLRFLLREGLLGSNLVVHGVEDSNTNSMLHEGMNRGWMVFGHRPKLRYFFKALVLQFGPQAAVVRWIVVLSCIIAFVLPAFFSREGYGNSDGDDDDNDDEAGVGDDSNQSSNNFIGVSLALVCGSNTEAMGDLFVDPVLGLMLVVFAAAMFVVYQVLSVPLKYLAVNITKRLFSFKSCSVIKDTYLRKTEDKVDEAKPTLDMGIDCALSKVQRSFFLFVHLLVLFFIMGDFFVWSNPVPLGTQWMGIVYCRTALTTAIIFYKPFFVSAFYCLNYLSDATGWMLWHNPLTDSIVAVLLIIVLLWASIVGLFSWTLLLIFFYFTIAFFVPPIAYFLAMHNAIFNSGIHKPREKDFAFAARMKKVTEKQRTEGEAATMIFKRLFFYSFFACSVFAISLYPYYVDGEGYVKTVKRVSVAVLPSLSFWSPEFALSFSWPRVSFPSQIGLAFSIGAFSLEYLLLAWQVGLAYIYPLGYAFDGMYDKEPALNQAVREGSADAVKALVFEEAKLDSIAADGRATDL